MKDKNYRSNNIRGKLRVHRYLSKDGELKPFLPRTTSFRLKHLKKMLRAFPALYVKPDIGSQGIGVYKISVRSRNFVLRSTSKNRTFNSPYKLYSFLKKNTSGKLIIQQGIPLETVEDRPYDIRSMMQRKRTGKWTHTGIFAKVGKPEKIVTNYYQGGKIVLLPKVFEQLGLSRKEAEERMQHLANISRNVALQLSKKKRGMYEMGIDFAFDQEGKLWIIEVNSRFPQFYPLKRLDRPMYRRMLSFAKSIGRTKS